MSAPGPAEARLDRHSSRRERKPPPQSPARGRVSGRDRALFFREKRARKLATEVGVSKEFPPFSVPKRPICAKALLQGVLPARNHPSIHASAACPRERLLAQLPRLYRPPVLPP